VVFFILPFFLMAGVALQSAGLYLCLFLLPLFFARAPDTRTKRIILSTAALLAACFFLPVMTQSLLALWADPLRSCVIRPPEIKSCEINLQSWLKSPVSAAFAGLAFSWTLLALRAKDNAAIIMAPSEQVPPTQDPDELRLGYFGKGLFWSSIVFFSYFLWQHLSGFNLLAANKILADEHRMSNGRYRIFGFYGHPLSLAGASLVWVSLALWSLLTCLRRKVTTLGLSAIQWLFVALLQSTVVYMTGGRTALIVSALLWCLLIALGLWHALKNDLLKNVFSKNPVAANAAVVLLHTALAAVLAAGFYFYAPNLNPRGVGGGTLGQGPLGDRPLFWQVHLAMWRDSPLLGQGYFAVQHGVRTAYYVSEGFADLRDKFNAHNIFLEVLGVSGLAGLLGYLTIVVLLFLNLKMLAGPSAGKRTLLGGLLVALAANLLHGLTQNTFFDSAITACYLALIGLFIIPPSKILSESK
jgi:O-antigen ligase